VTRTRQKRWHELTRWQRQLVRCWMRTKADIERADATRGLTTEAQQHAAQREEAWRAALRLLREPKPERGEERDDG